MSGKIQTHKSKNKLGQRAPAVLLSIFLSLVILGITAPKVFAATNLLTNPGAETDSTSGWTSTGSWAFNWNNAHSGSYSFDSSYSLGTLTQKVNLLSNGYTQSQLDNSQPSITFSVWLATRFD